MDLRLITDIYLSMIKKKIKLPIYNQFTITIIISNNITQEIVNITKQESNINYRGVFAYKQNGLDLILGFDSDYITQGVIAHECFHATAYILDYVGINLAGESEEAYSYLLGYLVEEVNKLIK